MTVEPTGRFLIRKDRDGTISVLSGVLIDGCPTDTFQELRREDGQGVNGTDYAALNDFISRFPREHLVSIENGRISPIEPD